MSRRPCLTRCKGFGPAILVALAILSTPTAATAQAETYLFDIPAQDLGSALRAFGRTSGQQIVFDEGAVRGLRSPMLAGSLSADAALQRLLADTGLRARRSNSGVIVVERQAASSGSSATKGDVAVVELEEIVVTGTHLRTTQSAVPVRSYSSRRIAESGTTNVMGFLNTLPEVSVSVIPDRFASFGGQTTVRLRGFPAGTTLTLLNGRRLAPSGDTTNNTFDVGALSLGMIDRIDVVPTGSSAIYGSDGIAGVVNFVTRSTLDGAYASGNFGQADGYSEQNYGLAWGNVWERGALSIDLSYDENSQLLGTERELTATGDFSQFADRGGADTRSTICMPGNVISISGANLPGLSSSSAAIPAGLSGRPPISAFVPTAGTQNRCGTVSSIALVPETERAAVFAAGRFDVTRAVQVFAEVLYSDTTIDGVTFGRTIAPSQALVPASNAFNPFGQDVRVAFKAPVAAGALLEREYFRPLIGVRGNFLASWDWELAVWGSRDDGRVIDIGLTNPVALTAALASSDPNLALNPFATSQAASPDVLSSVFFTRPNAFDSSLRVFDARLRGELFDLPAGPVNVVVGGEVSRHELGIEAMSDTGVITPSESDRDASAFYAELRLPILAAKTENANDADDLLALTAAARYDHYSDFGETVTPQVGLEWRPLKSLLFRASYGEAFLAPGLRQLYTPSISFTAIVFDTQQPGSPQVVVPALAGGNPDLDPETGTSRSVGLVWTTDAFGRLTVSVDAWKLTQDERISSPAFQTLIDFAALFPGRVVRDPGTNNITLLDTRFVNFGGLEAEGVDAHIEYARDTHWGTFTPSVDWTVTTKFDAALTPNAPIVDRLSQATANDAWAPRHKASAALAWSQGSVSARVGARYVSEYRDYQTPPNTNRLGDFWLWDVSTRIELSKLLNIAEGRDVFLTASANNVFDELPEYSNYGFRSGGYDPTQYDILGRLVHIGIGVNW